jgi:predicted RNase H-like HicB family nuclease
LLGPVGDGFELVQPLPVTVEVDQDGSYVVSDSLFGVYGHGSTEEEAWDDFSISLVEYHDIMAAGANAETAAVVEHLGTYLQRER